MSILGNSVDNLGKSMLKMTAIAGFGTSKVRVPGIGQSQAEMWREVSNVVYSPVTQVLFTFRSLARKTLTVL